MNPLEQLKSVLCDPEGKCCITASDEDRAIVDRALQALAQPEQGPSITKTGCGILTLHSGFDDLPDGTKFYTPPPKRPWVGLTDEKRDEILDIYLTAEGRARAIEAELKELNT